MIDIQFIDVLFQKYYGSECLAVKECRNYCFRRKKNIKTIAMHYQSLSIGGVQRVISLLTPMFMEMGYKLVIITEKIQRETDYALPDEVDIMVIPSKKSCLKAHSYEERGNAIHNIVIEKQIDMVCYHEPWNFTLYDFLAYKMDDVSFVLYKHTYISACMVGLDSLIYNQRFVFPLMDKVIVLSEVEKVFWEKLGVATEYIYNPIGEYANTVGQRDEKTILWVGRLDSHQKQYMDIVPIMKEVIKAIPDAVLKIYGNEYDKGAVEKLNRAIQVAGLEDSIKYCGYTTKDMNEIYRSASVHLMTSAFETFPMVVYESRVCGLPLVLYKMPYLEMLKDNRGYIEVDYDDTKAAADAIVNILSDNALRKKLSLEAQESIQRFSDGDLIIRWKKIMDSMENEEENITKVQAMQQDTMRSSELLVMGNVKSREMKNVDFIDTLFKTYYKQEYLAVKECQNMKFIKKASVKKIALQYHKLSLGGVERVISLLAPMYMEMEYEVVIITEQREEGLEYIFPSNIKIITIPTKSQCLKDNSYRKRAQAIEKVVNEENIDLVCYHEASTEFLLYDFLAYKQAGVNFVLVKHEYLSQYMVALNDIFYSQKAVFPLLDKVVVLSETEKTFWNTLGVNAEYIYNPIGDYARSEKGTCKKDNIIVWVGHLASRQKQYMDVIPIMKEVVKSVPDAVLKIYGNECDPGALDKLERAIHSEGLERNVLYCGYKVQNVDEIYGEAAVHLVTSQYETFPMVIYESKKNGLPLVLYRMPYLELLKDGMGYIAVENDNKNEAANALIRILSDKEYRDRLSEDALNSIASYSNDDLKIRWKKILDSTEAKEMLNLNNSEDAFNVIFDALLYHYHKGCVRHQSMQNELRELKYKNDLLKRLFKVLKNRNLPLVIYPYGKIGRQVKTLLNNELGITEAFIVDNRISSPDCDVKTVSDLKEVDCSQYDFLICSNSKEYYEEIRNELMQAVDKKNIIDLFSEGEMDT